MRATFTILVALCLCGCGDDDNADPGYGQLIQALGLGQGFAGPNRLGSATSTGNRLGADPRTPPASSQPGGAVGGETGSSGGCASACSKLVECGQVPDDGSCVPQCNQAIASAGAAGQAALTCITRASCRDIDDCI